MAVLPQKGVLCQVLGAGPVLLVSGTRHAPFQEHRVFLARARRGCLACTVCSLSGLRGGPP